MPRFRLTQEDINRSRLLDPGQWYEVEVVKVYDEPSRKGDSINTNVDLRVVSGPFAGAMLYTRFNEKAPGFTIPYLEAFGIKVEPDKEYDLKATEGRRLRVFVKHREYEGRLLNDVADYRSLD